MNPKTKWLDVGKKEMDLHESIEPYTGPIRGTLYLQDEVKIFVLNGEVVSGWFDGVDSVFKSTPNKSNNNGGVEVSFSAAASEEKKQ